MVEAGIVLDVGGDGELAARLRAFYDGGREISPRGIDGRREPGGTGAEDQHAMANGISHEGAKYRDAPLLGQPCAGAWLVRPRAVR